MSEELEQENTRPTADEVAIVEKDIDIFAGYLGRMENPDPTLQTESSGKGLKLYDEVDRDAHAGSVLQTRYLSVAGLEWEVLPADESAKAQEIAGFVEEALTAANLKQALQELLQAILYGHFESEVMWNTRQDGRWIPKKLIGKHPRRFVFTTERELRLLTPDNMISGEPVPDRKFITFTYGSSDNPYGKGLGQKLWWPVWFKKNGIKFWLIFLDKFGSPTPIGKYPSGTTKDQKDTLMDAIEAIHQETGVTIPQEMAIELLEAARTGNVTYEAMCQYMDRQMSKAVLGQTASTEGTPGKLGNDDAQDDVRQDIKSADADLLCEVFNGTLIKWIVDFNFFNTGLYPTFNLRTEEREDLKARAETDRIVIKEMGVPVSGQYFYDTYGYPRPEEDEEQLISQGEDAKIYEYHLKYGVVTVNDVRLKLGMEPVAWGDKPIELDQGENKGGAFSERTFTAEQQALEDLADQALLNTDLSANETAIIQAVQSASSFEEATENLLDLYPDLDMGTLRDTVERAWLNAELFGRWTVNNEN